MMEFFQVWLEMSHLDYCSANFLHVVYFEVKISDVLTVVMFLFGVLS